MMRRCQMRKLAEPADEALRVAHPNANVHPARQRGLVQSPAGARQQRNGRARTSSPTWRHRSVEADLVDAGRCGVAVRVQLAAAAERIDDEPAAVTGEDEFA